MNNSTKTAGDVIYPKAYARLVPNPDGGSYLWVVDSCPYCAKKHTHGGGLASGDPRSLLTHRISHCVLPLNRSGSGYVLVEGKRGRRDQLNINEHRLVAAEFTKIDAALSRILMLINGRVPVKILDQLWTGKGIELALYKLKDSLQTELLRSGEGPEPLQVYFPR